MYVHLTDVHVVVSTQIIQFFTLFGAHRNPSATLKRHIHSLHFCNLVKYCSNNNNDNTSLYVGAQLHTALLSQSCCNLTLTLSQYFKNTQIYTSTSAVISVGLLGNNVITSFILALNQSDDGSNYGINLR